MTGGSALLEREVGVHLFCELAGIVGRIGSREVGGEQSNLGAKGRALRLVQRGEQVRFCRAEAIFKGYEQFGAIVGGHHAACAPVSGGGARRSWVSGRGRPSCPYGVARHGVRTPTQQLESRGAQ
jgi:hypothetical protein